MTYEIDQFPGRVLSIEGKTYRYFGGTAYLGLQTDPAFQDLFITNIKKYGTNYGASRNSNVRLTVFERAEAQLAKIVGSAACTTLSSGYLAGQFVAKQFNQPHYSCFYAPNTHSALVTQDERCFDNYDDLNTVVRNSLTENPAITPVVFLDSIDFSGRNYPDFDGVKLLPLSKIIIVIDDSHGIGIVGHHGGGIFQSVSQLKPKELVVCASLGKGFGIQAGALFGSKPRMQQFSETNFFGGASPAAPAAMGTFLQAEGIYQDKRQLLAEKTDLFLSELNDSSRFSFMKGHPVFSFSDISLTNYLGDKQVVVTNFPYPSEGATVMSRIVISAAHTSGDISALAKLINAYRS